MRKCQRMRKGMRKGLSSTVRRTLVGASLAVVPVVSLATGCSSSSPTTAGPAPSATSKASGGTSGGKAATTGSTLATKEIGGYRFDVVSADVLDANAGLLPPDKDKTLVGINLSVTNTSSTAQPVSTFAQLALKLPNGGSAQEVPPADTVTPFKDGSLQPGATVAGYVLYEVPTTDLSQLKLEMIGDLSDAKATVDLSLQRK